MIELKDADLPMARDLVEGNRLADSKIDEEALAARSGKAGCHQCQTGEREDQSTESVKILWDFSHSEISVYEKVHFGEGLLQHLPF